MDTSIIYVDSHRDIRYKPCDQINCGSVYPFYTVEGLRITRLSSFSGIKSADMSNGNYIIRSDGGMWPEGLPQTWHEEAKRLCGFKCHENKLDITRMVEEMRNSDVFQFHIDPDAFTREGQNKYFFGSICMYMGECGDNDADAVLKLAKAVEPDFLGYFEFYISNFSRGITRVLETLKDASMPDAKAIIMPGYIAKKLPSRIGGTEVLALDIMDGGEPVKSRAHNGYTQLRAELDGEEFDLQKLTDNGKVMGVFDTHTHALLMFDAGIESPKKEAV